MKVSQNTFYEEILDNFGVKLKTNENAADKLEDFICNKKNTIILFVDEVDQLSDKHQETLYRLFELPHLKNSSLLLVAIANALDLIDRILPRLHAKCCSPKVCM